ncbi:TetR/AcrR family transcriptional regulator [Amycolatopsis sp. NPDC059657]|uniref:TetR/AcrR family transcriptional regulator n=1 Tax=Amycolatopsis sp. NPDC059657 TaxID=3346899 RepID=UPI00366A7FA4
MATRHGTARPSQQAHREKFLDAALKLLVENGVAGLTVRAVAELAGSTTIAVYTRFGGRAGVLDALYERVFELLSEALDTIPPPSGDPREDLMVCALAYRDFGLESPARYAFMFERPVPDFDPDPALRVTVLRDSFSVLLRRVERCAPPGADAVRLAYLLWTTMHGLVSVELVQQMRGPLPGWFLEPTPEANEPVYREGILAMINGLDL